MFCKFIASAAMHVIATALYIASAVTPVMTYKLYGIVQSLTLFETRTNAPATNVFAVSQNFCPAFNDSIIVGQAFIIVACVLAGLLMLFSAWRLARPEASVHIGILVVSDLLAIGAGFVVWADAFSLYDSAYCGVQHKHTQSMKPGPCGPLAFVAFIASIAALLVESCMSNPSAAEEESKTAPDAAPDTAPDAVVAEAKQE